MSDERERELSPPHREAIFASFARQGLLRGLGGRMIELGFGHCTLDLAFSETVSQQHGFFAGGAIGTLADVAGGYAAITMVPEGTDVLTVEYKINFLRPAAGERLSAKGIVLRAGKTLITTRVDVFDDHGRLCAAMQQTIAPAASGSGNSSNKGHQ